MVSNAKRRLRDSKQYLKIDYPVHCKRDESACADHRRRFVLSDSCDPEVLGFVYSSAYRKL